MCYTWKFPSDKEKEIGLGIYEKLPFIHTANVTGGEPFMRDDLDGIVTLLKKKTRRLVISTNGYFTDKIISLFKKHKDVGVRISLEGAKETNDELRGISGGFERGLKTIESLKSIGVKDIGFGMTICDRNAEDINELYNLSRKLSIEFATSAVHNSFYFHKFDNKFERPMEVVRKIDELIEQLLKSHKPKDWFRAYFNYGLRSYVLGGCRALPCEMGSDSFFIDPFGEIYPCNVMRESMGNLKEVSFGEIWHSQRAIDVRKMAKNCPKNCWMIGSVSQQMNKYFWKVFFWILAHKFLKKRLR
jgi:MoaA/NifB/PqqE/SkfB family radical SAM enzyme